jgi:hypothetical protein
VRWAASKVFSLPRFSAGSSLTRSTTLLWELQHGELPLADEDVLVVAGISDEGGVLVIAWQVVRVVVAPMSRLAPFADLSKMKGSSTGPRP